jgi:hypothetical protein
MFIFNKRSDLPVTSGICPDYPSYEIGVDRFGLSSSQDRILRYNSTSAASPDSLFTAALVAAQMIGTTERIA